MAAEFNLIRGIMLFNILINLKLEKGNQSGF